jgi:hypothetical protein
VYRGESSARTRYEELQWLTAEDFALLDDPDIGTDVEAVKARLAQNLAKFVDVRRQHYAELGLSEGDTTGALAR